MLNKYSKIKMQYPRTVNHLGVVHLTATIIQAFWTSNIEQRIAIRACSFSYQSQRHHYRSCYPMNGCVGLAMHVPLRYTEDISFSLDWVVIYDG
jgi:hypothetical protein